MKFRGVLIFIILISFFTGSIAQDHFELIERGVTEFNKIEDAFNEYYQRTGKRESDLKKFERWKYRMLPRLVDGRIPGTPQELLKLQEYQEIRSNLQSLRTENNENWESLGPEEWVVNSYGYSPGNGRINAVTVDPNNPQKIFAGAAAGGIWISENGGATWYTTTDQWPVLGITDIWVNPGNSQEVIVLTGDPWGKDTPSIGLIKSTDGGMNWSVLGLEQDFNVITYFRKLEVSTTDVDHMLVAGDDGIYLSTDGGVNWSFTLDANVSDILFHPTNSDKIYAAAHEETALGELTFYVSEDGGNNWDTRKFSNFGSNFNKQLTRKALAVSPADPDKVYVIAVSRAGNELGGFFSSNDELNTLFLRSASPNTLGWSKTGSDQRGQGWYDLAIAADPVNADVVYTGGVHVWKTIDGGNNWELQNYWVWDDPVYPYVHADVHSLNFYNNDLYVGSDGGLFKTEDGGATFDNLSFGMNIGQFYRLSVHPTDENIVSGGLQDNGSFYRGDTGWSQIYGADGMESIINYDNPSVLYSSSQFGNIRRYSEEGEVISKYISRPPSETGAWITPYIMHPSESNTVYFGFREIYKSVNQGNSMVPISDFENEFGNDQETNVLKQHPVDPNYLLVRKRDWIYLTRDEGETWTPISESLPPIAANRFADVAFSYEDPETIYATFGGWIRTNKVMKSTDGGETWENFSEGLPDVPVNCIISRNDCDATLYAGTDIGVFQRKRIDSEWTPVGEGLPNVIVAELEIQTSNNKLFAATYGRGIWKISIEDTEDQLMSVEPIPIKSWGDEDFELVINTDLPNEITTSSLDPSIADVNGTTVSVYDVGETFIRVEQEGTCTVDVPITVDKAQQEIIFEELLNYKDTEWDFILEAVSTAGLPITFLTDRPSVVKLEGNLALIQRAGNANITAAQNGNDYFYPATSVRRPVKIEVDEEAMISIFPNPVMDQEFSLYIPKNRGDSLPMTIYDMMGQVMHQSDVAINRDPATIDVSGLEQGVYIMKIGGRIIRFAKQ